MGVQIVKQPDGKWALWSTGVDKFVLVDKTKDEIVEAYVDDHKIYASKCAFERIDDIETSPDDDSYTWEICKGLQRYEIDGHDDYCPGDCETYVCSTCGVNQAGCFEYADSQKCISCEGKMYKKYLRWREKNPRT